MAVIKVFDAKGVKTLVLSGNAQEQPYDPVEEVSLEYAEAQADDEESE